MLVAVTPFTLEGYAFGDDRRAGWTLSMTMLPDVRRTSKGTWLVMILQWALLPVTFVLRNSLPAIDAQTRLMLGKYLGFNVTLRERDANCVDKEIIL